MNYDQFSWDVTRHAMKSRGQNDDLFSQALAVLPNPHKPMGEREKKAWACFVVGDDQGVIEAMMDLKPYQQRVIEELEELNVKRALLTQFFSGDVFPTLDDAEQQRMAQQHKAMSLYAAILEDRIRNFVKQS